MRAQIVEAPVEDALGAEIGLERHRADHVGGGGEPFGAQHAQRRDAGHHLRAVDQREAFLRAERDRLEPGALERDGARQTLAAIERLALADQRERHVRERREIAAGADRALARHDRRDAALEHRDDQVERLGLARPNGRPRASSRAARLRRERAESRSGSPVPAAWLRTKLSCSATASAGSTVMFASRPKPVVTP